MSVDDELERRLENWALWYWSGGRERRVSSVYGLARVSLRYSAPLPIINGEAMDTDSAVQRIDARLRDALRARYLRLAPKGHEIRSLSEVQVAAALLVSYDTYLRDLAKGRRAVRDELQAARAKRRQA